MAIASTDQSHLIRSAPHEGHVEASFKKKALEWLNAADELLSVAMVEDDMRSESIATADSLVALALAKIGYMRYQARAKLALDHYMAGQLATMDLAANRRYIRQAERLLAGRVRWHLIQLRRARAIMQAPLK